MSISCIIIEDQAPAQRVLKKYISDISSLELKETFSDALSALEYLKKNPIDLIFLDIHLPKVSGIDFLKILSPRPKIILTTAFSDYAIEGYELEILDYLLKPFSFERFLKAVSKVIYQDFEKIETINSATTPEKDFLFIKSGHHYLNIKTSDIKYIKSEGDYTCIYLLESKHLVSETLKEWQEELPSSLFCQIHKSYIVNIRFVSKISGNLAYIEEEKIPIGRSYKDYFFGNYLK